MVGTMCFCFSSEKFRFLFTVRLGPAFPVSGSIHYLSYLLEQSIDRGFVGHGVHFIFLILG